ncbi:MAG TPA: hypothetical protein VF623_01295 [Segetibacter sp.]|jgi:hypothetical protein
MSDIAINPTEQESIYPLPQRQYLKVLGKIFSYIFHPLFIPVYVATYVIFLHPYAFAVFDHKQKMLRLLSIAVITIFFPAMTVFLLWRLQFSNSIYLKTQKERIIPYVATIIYFFWAFYISRNLVGTPEVMTFFFLGIFLATSGALLTNNYFKISMHALGVGGAAAYMALLGIVSGEAMGIPIALTMIITGIVCTSRLLVSDHKPFEIYWGLIIGALAQMFACYVIVS